VSGWGKAEIVATGRTTRFGQIAESLRLRRPETEFERGVRRARRRCGHQMQAFLRRVDFGGLPVDTLAVAGYCPAAIYEAAAKKGADLIIISTHGRTGLRRALIGSVAEGTVRHTVCPVLVVPSFSRRREELVPAKNARQFAIAAKRRSAHAKKFYQ
jgi:hypothetical protein